MSDIVGDFCLETTFLPHIAVTLPSCSDATAWRLCQGSVDFIAAYYQALFSEPEWRARLCEPADGVHAIRFVVNEVLENAVKYNHSGVITLAVGVAGADCLCHVSNQVLSAALPDLRERLRTLITADLDDMLNRRLEENGRLARKEGSGLGYLLLQQEYRVRLGWQFDPIPPNLARIQTLTRLPMFHAEPQESKHGD